jgi:hypothetical protein
MSRRDLRSLRGLHHSTRTLQTRLNLRSLAITDINVMSVLFWWKTSDLVHISTGTFQVIRTLKGSNPTPQSDYRMHLRFRVIACTLIPGAPPL